MARTAKANITSHIPQLWAPDLYAEAENLTFWSRFEGPPGSTMPIIRRDDLEKQVGDTVKIDIVLALTGAGQTGDTTAVEGNEEALKFRQMSVTVDALSHGVRWTKLAKVLINHDMRTTALNQLAKWLAGKFDDAIFTKLAASTLPTQNKWIAGSATTRATLADSDSGGRLKLNDITELKAFAQSDLKIEPLRLEDGQEIFGLVLHPYTAMSLKKDSSYQQAKRDAENAGPRNPLFTGAIGMWDGVVLYVSNRVPRSLNGATPDIQVSDNIFFGAQALSRAYAYYPDWTEEEFDYGREAGVATYCVKGEAVNVFDLSAAGDASDNTAIGSVIAYAAAVAPSA